MSELKAVLDQLYESRSSLHLANDPLSFCHRYANPEDQEVAALIAASFAYGGIKIILRTLESIFAPMGPSPYHFVKHFQPKQGLRTFQGFKHRFNDARDLCALLWCLRQMIEQAGSIQAFFLQSHDPGADDVTGMLNSAVTAILGLDYRPVFASKEIPGESCFPFFFPSPSRGSACKRLCMFLRWVVRPADGFDLGLWSGISPARLIMPVDTHVARIGQYIGLTQRRTADWRMAVEITAALRRFDSADPVKYDFALAHLGISVGCDGSRQMICQTCPVGGFCMQQGIISAETPVLIN